MTIRSNIPVDRSEVLERVIVTGNLVVDLISAHTTAHPAHGVVSLQNDQAPGRPISR